MYGDNDQSLIYSARGVRSYDWNDDDIQDVMIAMYGVGRTQVNWQVMSGDLEMMS